MFISYVTVVYYYCHTKVTTYWICAVTTLLFYRSMETYRNRCCITLKICIIQYSVCYSKWHWWCFYISSLSGFHISVIGGIVLKDANTGITVISGCSCRVADIICTCTNL